MRYIVLCLLLTYVQVCIIDRATYYACQQRWRCARETHHRSQTRGRIPVCHLTFFRVLKLSCNMKDIWCEYPGPFLDLEGVLTGNDQKQNWSYCKSLHVSG